MSFSLIGASAILSGIFDNNNYDIYYFEFHAHIVLLTVNIYIYIYIYIFIL